MEHLRSLVRSESMLALFTLAGCAQHPATDPTPTAQTSKSLTACVTLQRGTLGDAADALLDARTPDQNQGADPAFLVGRVTSPDGTSGLARALLAFDLTAIPKDVAITSATLSLTAFSAGEGNLGVHLVLSPWAEQTITWNQFAGAFDNSAASLPAGPPGTHTVDLTPLVKAWVEGSAPNYGVLLQRDRASSIAFRSSEYPTAAARPALTVCYAQGLCEGITCTPAGPCRAAGTCDPATGRCSDPSAPDGTPCDDGDRCTVDDLCVAGGCTGGSSRCDAIDGKTLGYAVQDGLPPEPPPATCSFQSCDVDLYCPPTEHEPVTGRACILKSLGSVSWRICLRNMGTTAPPATNGSKGFWIGPVDLRRTTHSSWLRVIYRAGPAEILVPYHDETATGFRGNPTDTHYMNVCSIDRVTPADAGPNGVVMNLSHNPSVSCDLQPQVVVECRDRGLAWVCKGPTQSRSYRGQELVVWAPWETGNYDYITEYGFRDDGTISFRTGASGFNSVLHPYAAHMHDTLWRVDVDLNGKGAHNTIFQPVHTEGTPSLLGASDVNYLFNGGVEGGTYWDPAHFSWPVILDNAHNYNGNNLSYELVPIRSGTGRHFANDEHYTLRDFWATVYHPEESGFHTLTDWGMQWTAADNYLLLHTANAESLISRDVILWYNSPAHHEPDDEDRPLPGVAPGVTLMHWHGFELQPRNLFDDSPLHAPATCP